MAVFMPLSIPQAAEQLELSPARVRAMVVSGQLAGEKIGGRWVVERGEVERRRKQGGLPGRRFTAMNAWALLVIASDGSFSPEEGVTSVDEALSHLPPSTRSRLKRLLRQEGLENLAPRLGARARVLHYRAHPGELERVEKDPALMDTGITGAARFRLISGREVDGYLSASELPGFVERHVLAESPPLGNVRLRVVPDEAWRRFGAKTLAPAAAIALDLWEGPDPRSKELGVECVRALDREYRRRARR
jgi:hypothetical protein